METSTRLEGYRVLAANGEGIRSRSDVGDWGGKKRCYLCPQRRGCNTVQEGKLCQCASSPETHLRSLLIRFNKPALRCWGV